MTFYLCAQYQYMIRVVKINIVKTLISPEGSGKMTNVN